MTHDLQPPAPPGPPNPDSGEGRMPAPGGTVPGAGPAPGGTAHGGTAPGGYVLPPLPPLPQQPPLPPDRQQPNQHPSQHPNQQPNQQLPQSLPHQPAQQPWGPPPPTTTDAAANPGRASRRPWWIAAAVVLLLGAGGAAGYAFLLRDRDGTATASAPGAASATAGDPASGESTAGGSAGATPSTSMPPAITVPDPATTPAVDNPTGFTEPVTVVPDCAPGAGSDQTWELDPTASVFGAYAAARRGDSLALIDRVAGTTVWCTQLGLGSLREPAEVTSDSPVGRPGYTPALNADTLAASSPAGPGPYVVVSGTRIWVLQPLQITRPRIGSQQATNLHAFLALDDSGRPSWIASFATSDAIAADTTRFVRDASSGALVQVVTDPNERTTLTVRAIDVARGTASAGWTAKNVDTGWNRDGYAVTGGVLTMITEGAGADGDTRTVRGRRVDTGAEVFHSATTTSRVWAVVVPGQPLVGPGYALVVRGQQDGYVPSATLEAYALGTGRVATVTAPVTSVDLEDDCSFNGVDLLVCAGEGRRQASTLFAVDLNRSAIAWAWATGDPDPTTRVARTVPREFTAWHENVYARNENGDRYLLDARTGTDRSTPTTLDEVSDPFGSVSAGWQGVQLTRPTS